METEMTSLRENNVWDLVKMPQGKKTIGSKWVYKVKTGADESVLQQPKGFECQGKEEFVCKLNKSIYGLKQSPHCWNSTLDA